MNTAILVHGVTLSPRCMDPMAGFLRARGWKVLRPAMPGDGSVPIERLAGMLEAYIQTHTSPDERIDLVGFSMGGLVCRYYLQFLGGARRTDHFISIATPHRGSHVARLFKGAGMRQMRPGSDFLKKLNGDTDCLVDVACTVLYTPFDLIVVPASSARLPGLQALRFRLVGHPLMLYHPAVHRKVAELLRRPGG